MLRGMGGNLASILLGLLYTVPALVVAFSFHEFAHAYVADRLGDPTPRLAGRLTLSPLVHIDPIGFLFLLLGGFGWAKPVPINPAYFTNRRKGEALTALAGPLMNLLLAFVFAAVDSLLGLVLTGTLASVIGGILYRCVSINIALIVFNLIPIPPLDGFRVLKLIYTPRNMKVMWFLERYGTVILLVLMITRVSSVILSTLSGPLIALVYYPANALAGLIG